MPNAKLMRCIDNVLLSLRPKLKRTPYTITVECPDTIERDSYPGVFSQILTNLMMDALLHGFDGRDEGHIAVTVRQDREDLHVTFTDNGKSMDQEQLSHIFEPFFTTRREQGGTGLDCILCITWSAKHSAVSLSAAVVPAAEPRFC